MNEDFKDFNLQEGIANEPVISYATRQGGGGITYVHDEIDDLDWCQIPILGPKTVKEAIARIELAESNLNNPEKWMTSEQMWNELHQQFPWLR